jgi:hypothetical protein
MALLVLRAPSLTILPWMLTPKMWPHSNLPLRPQICTQVLTDPPGTVRTPEVVKAGQASYNLHLYRSFDNKWGTYSGMSLNPSNEDYFWMFNAYAGDQNYSTSEGEFGEWRTTWAKIGKPPPLPNHAIITGGSEISDLFAARDEKLIFKLKDTVQAGQQVPCALQVPIVDVGVSRLQQA